MNQHARECQACGFKNPVENKFCAQCGAALEAPETSNRQPLSKQDELKKVRWEEQIARFEKALSNLGAYQKGVLIATLVSALGLVIALLLGGRPAFDATSDSLTDMAARLFLFFFAYLAFFCLYVFVFMERQFKANIKNIQRKIEKLSGSEQIKISASGKSTPGAAPTAAKKTGLGSYILPVVIMLVLALLLAEIVPLAINTINPSAHVKAPVHIITSLVNKITGGAFKVGRCSQIPMTNIRYDWCNRSEKPPSSVDSDYVWCQFSSDQVPAGGHGFFPPECTPF